MLLRGHSNSRKIIGLLLRLILVQMVKGCILYVINVAGPRMKILVLYGMSRGDLLKRMITGQNPLDIIPLNESADERSGGWVVSWIVSQ